MGAIMTSWGYRILRQENPGETGLVSDHVCGIAEVFFDNEREIEAWTGHVKPCGESASEVVEDLMHMLQGAWNGPLDEAILPRDRKPAWAEEVDPATCISLEECRQRLEAKFGTMEPAEPQPEPVLFVVRHTNGVFHGREVVLGEARSFEAPTMESAETEACRVAWAGLAPERRPQVKLCFAWEVECSPEFRRPATS